MIYMNNLVSNLNLFDIKPSNSEEIQKIEDKFGIKLPFSLIEFFGIAGDDYNNVFDGVGACRISEVEYNLETAENLLNEVNLNLERPYFPFASHSGDQFMFVYLDQGDNPPVYRFDLESAYYEQSDEENNYLKGISKVSHTFSELLDKIIAERISS